MFLHTVATSLVAVVAVDLFFSFAAFGLSEPYWYFFGGLSVVTGAPRHEAISVAGGSGARRRGGRNCGEA